MFAPYINVIAETANKNVISSMHGLVVKGVVIPAGTAAIVPGTVLGRVTASGKYVPYAVGSGDGSQVAVCISLQFTTLDTLRDQVAHVAFAGTLVLDQLVGLDANAVTNLGGRQSSAMNAFQF